MYKLLKEMANNLRYKDKIMWETIQYLYVSQGMVDTWNTKYKSQ